MLEIYERLGMHVQLPADARIVLSHEQRDKGRLRTVSSEGEEVRIFLDRGHPLGIGEMLRSACGKCVVVEGAMETVVTATTDDWNSFSRACYHLGNRHVRIQIGSRWLRILPDHVLEELLVQLGLQLTLENHIFLPESGAYAHGHHHH